ncbi:MAG: IS1634 family transposase [Tissierellia bacterium]|jgi:transposase|nr:IS1634 family transposase [Clostridium sp.]NLY36074.1 IS1634 family transposase [Tissierellia bacterium]
MAYIVKRKNREGKYYVYLIESFREGDKVKKRTLKAYGSLDNLEKEEAGAFERLRKEAKLGLLPEATPRQLPVTYNLNQEITYDDVLYGWKILEELFQGLGIPEALQSVFGNTKKTKQYQKVLELLVYQRVLNPGSKLYTFHSQKDMFGHWNIEENTLYRSLLPLSQAKNEIQLQAHQSITERMGRTGTLVFYDVTNYYFEIDCNDEDAIEEESKEIRKGLRKKGPCKSKSGNPIVQLGLFMDTQGIPISYQLFSGNETDPITYIPAIEQVKKQFGLEKIIVVADKAMNSKKNITKTRENKDGWLFSQKHRGKRGAPKDIQEFILEPSGWIYNDEMSFAAKSMFRTRKLEGNKEEVKEKVLVTWNKKYALREKIRRDGALEYANKLTDAELFRQTSKKGGKRYLELSYLDKETGEIKPFSPLIQFNKEQIEFDEQFDGINVLVTSELDMSSEEMMERYAELYKIEDCFKITKSNIKSKPIYVRIADHIEAHFLTCFLALLLLRILQNKTNWEFSPGRLIEALQSARANELTTGFYRVQANDELKRILELLGLEWDKGIVRYEELNKFSKGWYTT